MRRSFNFKHKLAKTTLDHRLLCLWAEDIPMKGLTLVRIFSVAMLELRDEAVIDVHRCTAGFATHIYVIVALDGEFFKAPPALQTIHAVASAAPAA